MNTAFLKRAVGTLPAYWKLATIRCSIYALIVGSSAFDTGIEGYDSFHDMTQIQFFKLWEHVVVAIATVWVAFLDQSMSNLNGKKSGLTASDVSTQHDAAPKL